MKKARLRAVLLIAGLGAILALIDPVEPYGALAGLALIVLGTLLSAPAAPRGAAEPSWWGLLAIGAVLAAVGIPLALLVEVAGGLLTAVGGAAVVAAVALAFPGGGEPAP